MIKINAEQLERLLDFPALIEALRQGFAGASTVPMRHHHDYPAGSGSSSATLLLMPAWQGKDYFGLKILTVTPDNSTRALPTIQGLYVLFDTSTGQLLAQIEARTLTNRRTAAASALASSYLSRRDSQSLLMVGTGSLAPYLIQAHASVRPIRKVWVWGRNEEKASRVVRLLSGYPWETEVVQELDKVIPNADIISAATLSERPLIGGRRLRPGQHLDLVGSYRPTMREADDDCIRRAEIFVDSRTAAPQESGDLAIPIGKNLLSEKDIRADLFELCRNQRPGRQTAGAITLFKSVGHALEDLAAAQLAYQRYRGETV